MSEKKEKPAKNSGDTMMAAGVLMIIASILLPMIDIARDETTNLILLLGGLSIAVIGLVIRGRLRGT